MSAYKTAIASLGVAAVVVGSVRVGLGQAPVPSLPNAPIGSTGQSVTPAMEGWFRNPDGSSTVIVGYYNRNASATEFVDVPIGPNNRIEPGGPDQGQPTHFLGRRQWGMFSITLPKGSESKKLTWTLVANGQPSSITIWANPPYAVDPFRSEFNGNTPPVVKLEPNGPELKGPPRGVAKTYDAVVGTPLTLTLWVKDAPPTIQTGRGAPPAGTGAGAPAAAPDTTAAPNGAAPSGDAAPAAPAGRGGRGGGRGAAAAPGDAAAGRGAGAAGRGAGAAGRGGPGGNPLRMTWARYRGPAEPKFAAVSPAIAAADGKAETTVTFPEPGEYWLRAQFNDSSGEGGGGDQCCWSSVLVKVNAK